jgi:hypothetical protein
VLAVSLLFLYAFELARFLLGHELAAFLVPLCKDLLNRLGRELRARLSYERDPERLIRRNVRSSPVVVLVGVGERP